MSDGHDASATAVPEVVCLGESMTMLTASPAAPLRRRPDLAMHVGGAESNVACGLAHLGHHVQWTSRLGADPLGDGLLDFLEGRGVGTATVVRDAERPTGVYFKDSVDQRTTVYYYRRGSAAAAMSRDSAVSAVTGPPRLIHLSGITPALSDSCDDLLQALLVDRDHDVPLVSFDVNYRSALWPVERAASRLRVLADAADVTVVGLDEARTLWGTTTAEEVRDLLPRPTTLVVKDNEIGATCFDPTGTTFQPALRVRVVEPVGAGDAFAAGFLSGLLRGLPPGVRLRQGHVLAALTLQHHSDLPSLPDPERIAAWARLDGEHWAGLELGVPERLTAPTTDGARA